MGFIKHIVSGIFNDKSASKQQRAITEAANQGTAEQRRAFDTMLQLTAPQRYIGNQAQNALAFEMGLTPFTSGSSTATTGTGGGPAGTGAGYVPNLGTTTTNSEQQLYGGSLTAPTASGFKASPGYEFVRSEGQRGLERSAAARGGAFSGNALRSLNDFNNGLASQEYDKYWNRLASLAGAAQTASANAGAGAQHLGDSVANNLMTGGMARAGAAAQRYAGWNNTANSLFDDKSFLKILGM